MNPERGRARLIAPPATERLARDTDRQGFAPIDTTPESGQAAVAAEVTEMLASIQMLQKSEIFPIDYVCTSQLLKDNQLGSKVARADVFSDLITNPTGYILKSAPLIYFKRHPAAVAAEMWEVPHRMRCFIPEMARGD